MRLFLYRKDIEIIHGVCEKTARDILKDIKEHYNLPKSKGGVSISLYCKYYRIDLELVLKSIS